MKRPGLTDALLCTGFCLVLSGCPQEQTSAPSPEHAPGEVAGSAQPAKRDLAVESSSQGAPEVELAHAESAAPQPPSDLTSTPTEFDGALLSEIAGGLEVAEIEMGDEPPVLRNTASERAPPPSPARATPRGEPETERGTQKRRTPRRLLNPQIVDISGGQRVTLSRHLRKRVKTVVEFGAPW